LKRSITELLSPNDSAWAIVQEWIRAAANPIEILPANPDEATQALVDTQVSDRSPMGAIIYNTGGLLVDHGWLRLLGSGHPRLPRSIADWNRGRSTAENGKSLNFWLIADDVLGGFFALNGGAFGEADGSVYYFTPDTLRWESMNGIGYSDFVVWSFSTNLAKFYEVFRWYNWEPEVAAVRGDQAFSFYPFLWSKEGKNIANCSRQPCPVSEIFSLNTVEFPRQLGSK
jgi:hypothetical protein